MTIPAMPPIAILGAGPSGLALGRLLDVVQIPYIVFERDESATWAYGRGGSGTLDIHVGSGQLALQEAGLFDQFKALARYDASTAIADVSGNVLARPGVHGGDPRPEIDRRDLRTLLLDSVPAEKIHWGKKIQTVERGTDGLMSVHFADGSVESGFKLVVGADGAWSKTRSLVTSAKPYFSGLYFLTANISPDNPYHPSAAALAAEGNYMALGSGKMIAAQYLGDNSYYIIAGLQLPENWKTDNAALLEDAAGLKKSLLHDHFADWPSVHTNLINHCDGKFRPWPLYTLPAESLSWETVPGVALIGDAAHLTTPSGEGVNYALHDSLQLGQQIIKYGVGDLTRAVSEYEKLMFPRAVDLLNKSAKMRDFMFAPDAPQSLLRAFSGEMAD